MNEVDLGFSEERESDYLTNRYFPSKLGGCPAWLELDKLPAKDVLTCAKCKCQKAFLCQLYAPYDDENNFHRSIYIFICRSATCQEANEAGNITVLRSQLPRKNDFYSMEPPNEDDDPLPEIPSKHKLCFVCGCLAPLLCSRCKKMHYCCADHQRAHWSHHKKLCKAENSIENINAERAELPRIVFPEMEIVIESNTEDQVSSSKDIEKDDDDDDDEKNDGDEDEARRLAEFEKLKAAQNGGVLDSVPDAELEKYAKLSTDVEDKQFHKFQKIISKEPDQIVRYKRNGEPLWIADIEQTVTTQLHIPNCEYCDAPRQYEFQIMPQMLLMLKDEHLDWGVLVVYTCSKSCAPPSDIGYVKEYVVKQDIPASESPM